MEPREHDELELRELIRIIRKRLWLIVLVTIIATVTSGLVSFFILTPVYQASTEILVNQTQTEGLFNQADIRTNLELMNTYSVVMTSPRILDIVIEEYTLNKSYEQLKNQIKIDSVKNSQVMSITVTDPNYGQAATIANAVAKTFQREIITLMNIDNVHIMAEANEMVVPSQIKPRPNLNMAIAFVLGLMSSIFLVFLLEFLDNTLKTEQDIERFLALPVLGAIPTMDEKTEREINKRISEQMGGEHIET
jgi:capsular polysaccharide biosynthesis protein